MANPQVFAATESPPGGSLKDRYEQALKALQERQTDEDKTRVERDRLATETRNLQQRLVENAGKVQDLEVAYAQTAAELATLRQTQKGLEADLIKDRDHISHLLAVLQRLDADKPPALALRPDDSLAAVRGTLQVGAMLPPVYEQAAKLAIRLNTLEETSAKVEKSGAQAQAEAAALKAARAELDRLLGIRSRDQAQADARLTELHGVTEEISHQTKDLKGLIDRIATIRADASRSFGLRVVSPKNADATVLRRGSLRVPVVGTMTAGDPAGPGRTPGVNRPSGLWFEGDGLAEAVAPADSEVVFAGTYQKFGQVLILEIPGGYHLTLAGLGRIDVRMGDAVLAGEPVGVLPGGSAVRLYMELRRNGQAVDPAPWMSAELRKAKGT
jgi:septal ring factor EnvC (AmiA/AmiB activator)